VDYLKLLKAYISHVREMEGTDFLDDWYDVDGLSTDEIAELRRIKQEVPSK
jgi:hypothetical protein